MTGAQVPLTSRQPGAVLFRRPGGPVTREAFLHHALTLAERLPERAFAVNLCADRYAFAVAFAAAVLRGQTSLLTSDRSPRRLEQLAAAYPGTYALSDGEAAGGAFETVAVALGPLSEDPVEAPPIAASLTAAIVCTSGSTGAPEPHPKPWAALARCSEAAAERFGFAGAVTGSIVGTVPPQHMYGFETTVLLPLHAAVSSYAGATFFPHDIARALAGVPGPRTLVTTPLQMRALLAPPQPMPPLAQVISATAPLAVELAAEAEAAWGTRVLEIFGATEVGSIASRRTVAGEVWRTYSGVGLRATEGEGAAVAVPFLPGEVLLSDRVEVQDAERFRLLGRQADVVKLAGKRASLAGLNAILCGIEGVEDGAFLAPDDLDRNPTARLAAFVVAPTREPEDILAALRQRVEAPFLPRPIVKVAALPRNEVGKLARSALLALRQATARADGA